jgi:tetratricopeptide (TPR) repeat protein
MSVSAGGTTASAHLRYNIVQELEGDAVYLYQDDKFVYAACTDSKVRVWSKSDWQLIAELGETTSPPLAVQVDEENVYATCERRVYVWNKNTWGMIGWFELSYSAVTSTLCGEYLYVGAKEGRLVSIKKDTHDTSSWQLYKADITNIWADEEIICASTSKGEPVIWKLETAGAPTEILRLDKKDKGAKLVGNNSYVISGVNTSDIKIFDRVDWSQNSSLPPMNSNGIISLWANNMYVVAASNSSNITIWDLKKQKSIVGSVKIDGIKITQVLADKQFLILATTGGIVISSIALGSQPLDLSAEDDLIYGTQVLRTSPYDVLEVILELQRKGDGYLEKGAYHEAVTEFEHALQLLIDNTQALLEVPEEREKLTNDLNTRLGQSLLRSKIVEIGQLSEEIKEVATELDKEGRTSRDDPTLDNLWMRTTRIIKESRVLSEAQGGHILSYQLSHATDQIEAELSDAREKLERYKEKINHALTLAQNLRSEWRWIERKRTSLDERLEFLNKAIKSLESRIKESEDDEEVIEILSASLIEYTRLRDQLTRIVAVAQEEPKEVFLSRDETIGAIQGILSIIPKRKIALSKILDETEKNREIEQLVNALQQALEAAEHHKMKDESLRINAEIAALLGFPPEGSEEVEQPKTEVILEEVKAEPEKPKPKKKEPAKKKKQPKKKQEPKPKKPVTKKKSSKKTPAQKKS